MADASLVGSSAGEHRLVQVPTHQDPPVLPGDREHRAPQARPRSTPPHRRNTLLRSQRTLLLFTDGLIDRPGRNYLRTLATKIS
ncbi:hypothetical protein [Actinokineospora inagensis]|uniref:hypothetical protein n=1 Tax=Actinokineospora inagensis TaxID=103730 RepID=UPI00040110F0|nr:hypothetical protein [Actinokineospora inagensis]